MNDKDLHFLVGVPATRFRKDFDKSFISLIENIEKKYKVDYFKVYGMKVDESRNEIVKKFLSKKFYTHLLFLDDDHTGHTLEMFNALLKSDKHICAIKTYMRHYPYYCVLMKNDERKKRYYLEIHKKSGYHECDVVGFGMVLIKRETFKCLKEPYFIGSNQEDFNFCRKLKKYGIKPFGCFDYTLTHDGINEKNVLEIRKNKSKLILKKRRYEKIKEVLNGLGRNS